MTFMKQTVKLLNLIKARFERVRTLYVQNPDCIVTDFKLNKHEIAPVRRRLSRLYNVFALTLSGIKLLDRKI